MLQTKEIVGGEKCVENKYSFRLDGFVAFVSGGGNGKEGGMGAAICRCLGRAGACVAVNDLTEEAVHATVTQLEPMEVKSLAVPGDIGES